MKGLISIIYFVASIFLCKNTPDYYPDQIHLSIGETNTNDILVVWVTDSNVESVVEYAYESNIFRKNGTTFKYVYNNHTEFIHKVTLNDLKPNTYYIYHCGSPSKGWSAEYSFKTFPSPIDGNSTWAPRLLLFGDLGVGNARSLARMQEEIFDNFLPLATFDNEIFQYFNFPTQKSNYTVLKPPLPSPVDISQIRSNKQPQHQRIDAILHIGDIAYDMHDDNGLRGAQFLREIQPLATRLPYITCPGNHESHGNFTQYKNKFAMPRGNDMFYSFNLGPAHFISFSTEYYFSLEYGIWQIKNQYEWLENDLKEANKHRDVRPWIITFGHRPMYCSNKNVDDCTTVNSRVRTGLPFLRWYSLEPLFYKYNVDLELWAHEHDYERLWPIYNYKVKNGTVSDNPYHEPQAPVHIITGSAGCSEQHDTFSPLPNWSAFRSLDYGYSKMWIANKTHIYIEQISDDQDGKIIDKVWIIKEKRLPYAQENFTSLSNNFISNDV